MCARLVGLPDVTVLAVDDRLGDPIRVHVELAAALVVPGDDLRWPGQDGR
jgi:hypothetical protein